jgi:NADP-dependent 3-hydroxy acid dehydrogenase YdfG
MTASNLSGTPALVTGASRGFGRAIAVALHGAGADVVAVARNSDRLDELRDELGGRLETVAADVADPVVAGSLIEQYGPITLVLNAGAPPLMRPIQHQIWQTFSRNWDVDVQQAFHWISASHRPRRDRGPGTGDGRESCRRRRPRPGR